MDEYKIVKVTIESLFSGSRTSPRVVVEWDSPKGSPFKNKFSMTGRFLKDAKRLNQLVRGDENFVLFHDEKCRQSGAYHLNANWEIKLL